jgi:hypothetical protein
MQRRDGWTIFTDRDGATSALGCAAVRPTEDGAGVYVTSTLDPERKTIALTNGEYAGLVRDIKAGLGDHLIVGGVVVEALVIEVPATV